MLTAVGSASDHSKGSGRVTKFPVSDLRSVSNQECVIDHYKVLSVTTAKVLQE